MPQIIPIKELKNTAEISDMCHKTDEPIYITKNGYGDMVIMSMKSYEDIIRKISIYYDIAISEQQIAEGNVKNANAALMTTALAPWRRLFTLGIGGSENDNQKRQQSGRKGTETQTNKGQTKTPHLPENDTGRT